MMLRDSMSTWAGPKQPAAQSPSIGLRRANSLVLVTAILVLLVIIASAFVVRSQSVRAQAASQQRALGRNSRVESATTDMAQMVADALFTRRIDASTYTKQVQANFDAGMVEPGRGHYFARSDFPTLPPYPFAIRYEVDMFDGATGVSTSQDPGFDNRFLAPYASAADKALGKVDGYNYAPYAVNPFTNWPLRYGEVPGESNFRQWFNPSVAAPDPPSPYPGNYLIPTNPRGNPGFGDSRWLASTEPVRAELSGLVGLALDPATDAAKLSPLGLGFSHWPHMSWIATPNNGYRVCWDISDLDANTLDGTAGTALGEISLGTPYEQWLSFIAPKKLDLVGQDSRGYLIPSWKDFRWRYAKWFNRNVPAQSSGMGRPDDPISSINTISASTATGHEQAIRGVTAQQVSAPANRYLAPPNFLQLASYGDPSEEYKVYVSGDTLPTGYVVGDPKPRNLISRTLADTDGDGWTDSFWFVAPTSADRGTRQLVAVRIMDNSALLNVNTATTFERTNSLGQTPSDVALVSRRDAYDLTADNGRKAGNYDPAVGFFNAQENDPEHRMNGVDAVVPIRTASPSALSPYSAGWSRWNPNDLRATSAPSASVYSGLDVAWTPQSWEGPQTVPSSTSITSVNGVNYAGDEYFYRPSMLSQLGVIRQGRSAGNRNKLASIFDTFDFYFPGNSGASYGDFFALSRPADRATYFKAMANDGVVVDPVTAARVTELTPFGVDDEVELRGFNGLNDPQTTSRLEASLNWSFAATGATAFDQFLRSSRSREETARFLTPDDPRLADYRVRAAGYQQNGVERRAGYELLLDHRRLLTTVSGGRNEMLPTRLWTLQDYTLSDQRRMETAIPAYDLARDANGDVFVPPYHPNRMFPSSPRVNSPIWGSVADVDGDSQVTDTDFLIARQRFVNDNRKIDLRQPSDETAPPDVAATYLDERWLARNEADQAWARDIQRLMRRSLIDAPFRGASGGAAPDSLFGRPGAPEDEKQRAWDATKGFAASFAANLLCYRDGDRFRDPLNAGRPINVDSPLFPSEQEAVCWPTDAKPPIPGIPDPVTAGERFGFIGIERQPVIQEVFIALVYPVRKLTNSDFNACTPAVTVDADGTIPSGFQGSGQFLAGWDASGTTDKGRPAIVFAIQIANPFNAPVKLREYAIRVNGQNGLRQTFRFNSVDYPALDPNSAPGDFAWGNSYGTDVELGPCTPEEPRSAIVFAVPDKFPNGDAFPRDAWLDFLDLRASIDENQDGTVQPTEPTNTTQAGKWFPRDPVALFRPAWTDSLLPANPGPFRPDYAPWSASARGGTLLFDATAENQASTGTLPGFRTRISSLSDLQRWTPPDVADDDSRYIELVRTIPSSYMLNRSAEVVVDRFDNKVDTQMRVVGGDSFAVAARDCLKVVPFQVSCNPDPSRSFIDGVRMGQRDAQVPAADDSKRVFVKWARAARQWLFDVNRDGRLATNERVPRFAFARTTGVMGSDVRTSPSAERTCLVNGQSGGELGRGNIFNPAFDPPDTTHKTQASPPVFVTTSWMDKPYTNVWGQSVRGKPVFFSSRVFECDVPQQGWRRIYPPNPAIIPIPDNQWRYFPDLTPQAGVGNVRCSYGEKGPTDASTVEASSKDNFLASYRLFQKDADFDQVAEILDVPMWGPIVNLPFVPEVQPSGATADRRTTYITLPEILALPSAPLPSSSRTSTGVGQINLPKVCASALEPASQSGSGRVGPWYGSLQQQTSLNRLSVEPPAFDIPWPGDAADPTGVRPSQLTGFQVLPSSYNTPGEMPIPQQNGIGFNNRLPGVVSLLDAFTLDDRGASPLDANGDNSISPSERAGAEDRRLRLAGGFAGKRTPGLININTAPVEVLRAMPHMTRLAYDDDFQIALTADSDPANLKNASTALSKARRIRDPLRWEWSPAQWSERVPPSAAGAPFPTVRVADSIEIWRDKLNPLSSSGQWTYPELPSYVDRGFRYDNDSKFKEFAADMRVERGFESIGELGLLLRGASGQIPGADMNGNNKPDIREIAAGELLDLNRNGVYDPTSSIALSSLGGPDRSAAADWGSAVSPSIRYGGFDPFRSTWDRTTSGDGGLGANSSTTKFDDPPYYTDGVPQQSSLSGLQTFSIGGRTAIDPHRMVVATDDPTTPEDEADDGFAGLNFNAQKSTPIEKQILRNDLTSGDAIEQNTLLKGISNIVTTRSDVFTVWVRVRTIRQNPLTGKWNATDPDQILDDSRYLMTVDRSSVDRPGDAPKILSYVRLPK